MISTLEPFEEIIKNEKLLEVENAKMPERGRYVIGSLWDENIFGKSGSKDRKTKFGYIDLKSKYITPVAFKIIQTLSQEISQVLNNKGSYIVKDGKLVPDEFGETGIAFFLREHENIDFIKSAKEEKKDSAIFVEKNKKLIFINKWLVIPPSPIRDIDVFQNKGSSKSSSEINDYYARLIYLKNTLIGDELLDSAIIAKIQQTLNGLYTFVINSYFKGKRGIFRSKIMKKNADYTSRLVLTSSPKIPLGSIGLPLSTCLIIFEPYLTFYKKTHPEVDNAIKQYLGMPLESDLPFQEYEKFIHKTLPKFPHTLEGEVRNTLYTAALEIVKEQIVCFKRDPVGQRNAWTAAKPIPLQEGQIAMVNSLDLAQMGGDCMKGNVRVFTKDEHDNMIEHIIKIDEFHNLFKIQLIENKINDRGIKIYDFIVLDHVYALGINKRTGEKQFTKIQKWSIHDNLNLYEMTCGRLKTIISDKQSCYCIDHGSKHYRDFIKVDIDNIIKEPIRYSFIQIQIDEINLIPAINTSFEPYINEQPINIQIENLQINSIQNKIAYDFTMEDSDINSFSDVNGLVHPNCDGDTIGVYSIFSDEAKEEVKSKMYNRQATAKYKNIIGMGKTTYNLDHDVIATIFNATKE